MLARFEFRGLQLKSLQKDSFGSFLPTRRFQDAAHVMHGHHAMVQPIGGDVTGFFGIGLPLQYGLIEQAAIFQSATEIDVSRAECRRHFHSRAQRIDRR